jgi:hypothetical protein
MKHDHLRKEKNCLNCGSIVDERYCSRCGQENTEVKESFRHLIGHFTADITHYDSQILTTIKDLVLRPGFMTKEYNAGRRISYLNPIRMYIFISAIFFLVAFSSTEENNDRPSAVATGGVNIFRQHVADSLRGRIKLKNITPQDKISNNVYSSIAGKLDSTVKHTEVASESVGASFTGNGQLVFRFQQNKYHTIKEYDSIQNKLNDTAKDGFFLGQMIKKSIRVGARPDHSGEVFIKRDIDHDIERIMFVMLPLFALYVGFFYNRKKYWYSQQAIFSLHFHSFIFLCLLLVNIIGLLTPGFTFYMYVLGTFSIIIFVYLIAALYRVYEATIWLTIIKAMVIMLLYLLSLIVALMGLIIISFMLI